MAAGPFTAFVDGNVMVSGTVASQCDLAFNWLNGRVVSADITSNTLNSEQIQRPESRGFPVDGTLTQTSMGDGWDVTYDDTPTFDATKRPARWDIFPKWCNPDGYQVTDLCWRRYVERGARLRVFAWWAPWAVKDPAAGGAYPDDAGSFVIRYRRASTKTVTAEESSRRPIHLNNNNIVGLGASIGWCPNFNTLACIDISAANADVYDVYLCYDRPTTTPTTNMIVVGHRGISVEVDLE